MIRLLLAALLALAVGAPPEPTRIGVPSPIYTVWLPAVRR